MPYGLGFGAVLEITLIVYCLLDVYRTPAAQVRNLPKPVWFILCFIPPILGPVSWLVFGRPKGSPTSRMPYKGNSGIPPMYDRPGRSVASNPDDDAAFLKRLQERAEEQRRRSRDPRDDDQP